MRGARLASLAADAPLYGPMPENPDFTGSAAAVLGIYGGLYDAGAATKAWANVNEWFRAQR